MKKEYDFSKAKVHKGPLLTPKGSKIQKTFRLDESVYHWLIDEGKKQGIPYQTLIASVLHKYVNGLLAEKPTRMKSRPRRSADKRRTP